MKAAENQFLPFLEGKKQFIIPIYQRTYSWTREQCEQLWNDIVRAATDKEVQGHFLGSIVFIQRGLFMVANIPQLLVIDGQQRLTTLSLLLVALAKAAEKSTKPLNISHEDIYDSYLINKHGRDEQRYKLLLTQSDKDTLVQLIDDPDQARSLKTVSRLLENYLFFEEKIRQSAVDPYTLFIGISKLIIVEISLDRDHDNPQLIFESLNSTGMDLSQADLIRNYVLMGLDNDEQARLYKFYWYPMEQSFRRTDDPYQFDRFMRDYLTVKQGAIPNIDKVYASFKTYQRSKLATPISEIVADVYRYSQYFVNMAFLQEEDREIKRVLNDINTLKVDVAYPFLLEVYDDYANRRLSREDLIAILRLVESYVFRRVICGIPTNALNKIFATLSREIDKEHYLESVQSAFLTKLYGGRFPRDEEFRAAFVVKDVYNFRSRNYMLRKLENYEQKELVNVESCTIEHIMPQNEQLSAEWRKELGPDWQEVHARYLHTIGNLTLTAYNSELSDRSFREKRDMEGGFAHSPVRLNRSLDGLEHWNKEEIEKRAQALAELAVKAWPMPVIAFEEASRSVPSEAIGPLVHPLAGFIPAGFKIIQHSGRRFYLFRNIENEWVQYGNGKKPSWAVSWKYAGEWARDKNSKNEKPLGIGGEVTSQPEILAQYSFLEDTNGSGSYEPQAKRLSLSLNMKFSEINDPKDLCKDLTSKGHYTNGDVGISVTSLDQIDDVMDLIRQSFEKHWEDGDV